MPRLWRRGAAPPERPQDGEVEDEDEDDADLGLDEALDAAEKGRGGAAEHARGRSGRAGRCGPGGCESCTDWTAWRTLGRLLFAFRFTQYLDVLLSVASFAGTVVLASLHEIADVQLPVLALALAGAALFVPWVGVLASFRMHRCSILLVVIFNAGNKLVFNALQLVYLYTTVAPERQEGFLAETILSALRLVLGLFIVGLGLGAYRKLRVMHRERKDVLVVGLDGCGKSLLVDNLLPEQVRRQGASEWLLAPTDGIAFHEFVKFDALWRVWDMSGNGRARALWPHYYGASHAIVFVVDGADLKRLGTARDEFARLVEHPHVQRARPIILVLLNKVDLPEMRGKRLNRLSAPQLRQVLQLDALENRFSIRLQPCSGLSGSGVEEGLQWVLTKSLSART